MSNNNIQSKIKKEIEDLTKSINEIIVNFRELKNPLEESQSKVPLATNQLDKISEQTEAATHQMLDIIDQISVREEEIIAGLEEARSQLEGNEAVINLLSELTEKANGNLNDAFTIMNALQFQDITSQQMNHAASLLEDIEARLKQIMQAFGTTEEVNSSEAEEKHNKRVRVFDPNADLYDKKTQQKEVDSMFDKVKNNQ